MILEHRQITCKSTSLNLFARRFLALPRFDLRNIGNPMSISENDTLEGTSVFALKFLVARAFSVACRTRPRYYYIFLPGPLCALGLVV